LWSVNYIVAKTAPGIISPHVLALGRWFLAGLILAFIARSELWQERQSTLNAWKQYVVLGSLGMLICGAWVYWAAETTTAINIALIYAASPVLITLGAVIGLKESFSWRQSLGVVIALLGVLHVVAKGQWTALSQVVWVFGDGLVVIAMVAWAAYALLLKKWASPLSSTARLAATCFAGSLVLLPLAITEWTATQHAGWSDSQPTCRGSRSFSRRRRLLVIRVLSKNLRRQPSRYQPLSRPFVRRLGGVALLGRNFGMASRCRRCFYFARHLPGFAKSSG
jgi:drug/metabolite transporter (DMT)-like permease